MKNYGIEFEFFVIENKTGRIIPAYTTGITTDGNPFIGEIRTDIHKDIYSLIYELKKIIHITEDKLLEQGCSMKIIPEVKISKELYKELRSDKKYTNSKELESLTEYSVYNKKTGKILSPLHFKASLQLNISDNDTKTIWIDNKSSIVDYSNVFNYFEIIQILDAFFNEDITKTHRTPGVYAIKEGKLGNRVEYRSLPNTINLDKLLLILLTLNNKKKINKYIVNDDDDFDDDDFIGEE